MAIIQPGNVRVLKLEGGSWMREQDMDLVTQYSLMTKAESNLQWRPGDST